MDENLKLTAVLDKGYVAVVETWGSDEAIVRAARMSTDKGFQGWGPIHEPKCALTIARDDCPFVYGDLREAAERTPCTCVDKPKAGDEKLLAYLYDHKHMTPFEMAGMVIEVKAPIFVFREWHRHRTQSYNEMSARYVPLPEQDYIPSVERLMMNGGANKQAAGVGAVLTEENADAFRATLARQYGEAQALYVHALAVGIPKELARLILPVGRYSKMRASTNLRNWLAFMTLRCAPDAQWKIRQYANQVAAEIKAKFPRTYALWCGAGETR